MTIVTQLNELAEKMTGTNPKATTDEVALDFIERNYNGGGSGGGNTEIIEIDDINWEYGASIEDEAKIQQVIALRERIKNGEHPNILLKTNWGTNDLYIKTQNYAYMNEEGYEGLWIVFNYIDFNQSEMKILQLQYGNQYGISELHYETIVSSIVSG